MMSRITFFIFKIIPFLIIALILFAACNHFVVNFGTQEIYSNLLDSFEGTQESNSSNDISVSIDSSLLSYNEHLQENCYNHPEKKYNSKKNHEEICQKIIILENLKKYHFDSNTVTFLVSLIAALLMSIIFNYLFNLEEKIENKYLKPLLKSNKIRFLWEKFYDIYVKVESIYVESIFLKQSLLSNNQIINTDSMEVVYTMYRKVESLLALIRNKRISQIPENIEKDIVVTMDNTLNNIRLESIKRIPENKGNTRYLDDLYDKLTELRYEILKMETVKV